MAFKSKAELEGKLDPNIWTGGSVNPEKKGKTRREQHQSELVSLIRRFRPLQTEAIKQAMRVMKSEQTADQNVLRASALILQTYQGLLKDLVNTSVDDDKETIEQIDQAPKFSLVMLPNKDKDQNTK